MNPQVDGDLIRIPVPALSEQRRKDLVKIAKKSGEECKVAVRKARHEALDMLSELKEGGDASEDEVDRAKKKAEELVSEAGQSIDQIIATKEKRSSPSSGARTAPAERFALWRLQAPLDTPGSP